MSAPQTPAKAIEHLRIIFVLVIAAYFLDIIDASIVQVALPTIQRDFGSSLADLQWVYGAYALTIAGFLMLMGRAGDVYGQKKVFVAGLAVFTAASFLGGLAPSLLALIGFRLLQGVGAAMTTVTAFAIFIGLFPEGPERNRALGVIVAVLSGGFAAGATTGGVLTTYLGWRSVMYVNVPIGIATLFFSQKYLPGGAGLLKGQHLDLPGAVTVTAGTMLLVYGLTNAAGVGLTSQLTTVPIVVSALILAAFVVIESRSKAPLMPLSFLSRGSVLTANALALVLTSIVGGISFILTIYLQTVLGYSPIYAALGVLPAALIFFFVGGWGAARVMDRLGAKKTLIISSVIITAGTGLLLPISTTGSYFTVLPGVLVWALGASIGFPAVNIAAVAGTKHGEEGLASGIVNTSFRLGFPIGLAVLLTVAGAFDPAGSAEAATAAGTVLGFQYAILAGVLLGALAVALTLVLKDVKPSWGQQAHSVAA